MLDPRQKMGQVAVTTELSSDLSYIELWRSRREKGRHSFSVNWFRDAGIIDIDRVPIGATVLELLFDNICAAEDPDIVRYGSRMIAMIRELGFPTLPRKIIGSLGELMGEDMATYVTVFRGTYCRVLDEEETQKAIQLFIDILMHDNLSQNRSRFTRISDVRTRYPMESDPYPLLVNFHEDRYTKDGFFLVMQFIRMIQTSPRLHLLTEETVPAEIMAKVAELDSAIPLEWQIKALDYVVET